MTAAKLVWKQQWWDPPLEIPSLGSVLVQSWQMSFGLVWLARQINNSGHFINCSLLVTLKRQVYLFGVFRLEPLLHFCLWHKSFCTNLTRCFHTKSSSNKRRRRRRRRRNWSLLESCWPRVSPPHTCTLQSNAMESNVDHTELTPRLSNYYLTVVNSRPSSQLHWADQQGTHTACMHSACSYDVYNKQYIFSFFGIWEHVLQCPQLPSSIAVPQLNIAVELGHNAMHRDSCSRYTSTAAHTCDSSRHSSPQCVTARERKNPSGIFFSKLQYCNFVIKKTGRPWSSCNVRRKTCLQSIFWISPIT